VLGGTTSAKTPTATGTSTGPPGPFKASMFSFQLPVGDWVLEHSEQQRQGYVDTRWHLAGDPKVVFVVDYTTGYQGNSVAAANSVRQLLASGSNYQEISFAPLPLSYDTAQRWEYIAAGVHSIDTFSTACGTSYAARGGAPAAEFAKYASSFDTAIQSLEPSCLH
jgi:hypothetical protein